VVLIRLCDCITLEYVRTTSGTIVERLLNFSVGLEAGFSMSYPGMVAIYAWICTKRVFQSHSINVLCFSCYTNHLPALDSDIWGLVALFGIWKNGRFGSVIKSTILIAPKIQQTGFLDASYRKWIYWMITLGGDRSRVTGCFFDELKFSEFFTWPISWISLFLVILN
jgi:hypothetical protein